MKRFLLLTSSQIAQITLDDFTVSELTRIIKETPISEVNKRIAVYRFIKKMPYEQIAEYCGLDTRTIMRHSKTVSAALLKTFHQLVEEEQ